jgi:hypothetical protein
MKELLLNPASDIERAIATAVAEEKWHGATPEQMEALVAQIKARAASCHDDGIEAPRRPAPRPRRAQEQAPSS